MKLITIRSQILEVVDRWKQQYPDPEPDKAEILSRLEMLNLKTSAAKDLEDIIGNPSWAQPQQCYECDGYFDEIVQVGEEPDYESATAYLCKNCVMKALKLFDRKWP